MPTLATQRPPQRERRGGRMQRRRVRRAAISPRPSPRRPSPSPRRAPGPSSSAWPCRGCWMRCAWQGRRRRGSAATRSVGWAPTESQCLQRSRSSLTRFGVVLLEHRIEGADLLDVAAVARRGRVGDDDVIVRALLGAAARQADLNGHCRSFLLVRCVDVVCSFRSRGRHR